MRISGLESHSAGNIHTLSAKVTWEDCDRPAFDAFYRTRGDENLLVASNYNSFLTACIGPAVHYGERRIHVDGEVCPWLADNLISVSAYLNHWFHRDRRPDESLEIEAASFTKPPAPKATRFGAFFSGGVDSVHTLGRNLAGMPAGHPARIRDAIFIHGLDLRARPGLGSQEEAFEYFVRQFQPRLASISFRSGRT